jgi:hypothetical protein
MDGKVREIEAKALVSSTIEEVTGAIRLYIVNLVAYPRGGK